MVQTSETWHAALSDWNDEYYPDADKRAALTLAQRIWFRSLLHYWWRTVTSRWNNLATMNKLLVKARQFEENLRVDDAACSQAFSELKLIAPVDIVDLARAVIEAGHSLTRPDLDAEVRQERDDMYVGARGKLNDAAREVLRPRRASLVERDQGNERGEIE